MSDVRPFRAVRPAPGMAEDVAALPYDVMTAEEARVVAGDNPLSFLHVDKAEIDLDPSLDPYDGRVYERARENFASLRDEGVLRKDARVHYYLYRLTMEGVAQTGVVACPSVDDCLADRIKKHELTRADKEADRIRHVDVLDANTGPIFLTHRPNAPLAGIVSDWIDRHGPIFDFTRADGIRHEGWVIDDADVCGRVSAAYRNIPTLYIADGHHRCASAVKVALKRRAAQPGFTGEEEFNYFLAVVFPSDELRILDYNRVVKDLGGRTPQVFLEALSREFEIEASDAPVGSKEKHVFGLFLDGRWYRMAVRPGVASSADPVDRLDVSILQQRVFGPLLGITDPRTDKRIDFIGGIRGLGELERRVRTDMAAAFSLCPTGVDDLMDIADAGKIMPPKSTWFEPKLLSGLFIHDLK
ncbi:MAG: DUF1015 family protein [Clostridiales Family XIII bacterium]|jgi:uncharacterized protein (DUF1015 family)|nr:DUF1015 family protein [Clostridiales Family XIII bacterium]